MTVYFVVAVRDSAMDAFMPPFNVPHIGLASRSFNDEINNRESPMYKHPEDYELYQLATWNDATGIYEQLSTPNLVARGKDVVVKPGDWVPA